MLTEVKAYSSWQSAPTLPLGDPGMAETDLIQIRNIDGLDPVKAAVNTSALGSVDGTSYVGSSVLSRNIVLTIHPNPDWDNWTFENLRRLLYSYFMPKRPTRLVFYSDDEQVPVEISGIIESVENNLFSKDPELLVSVICPDPYFTALEPTILSGQAIRPEDMADMETSGTEIDYNGSIETGIQLKLSWAADPAPTLIGVQIGDPAISYFNVHAGVTPSLYFEMSSIPMNKFVQNINLDTGVISNLLSRIVQEGSTWPTLQPGENYFCVFTDQGVQDWELTYYERFGGL